MMLMALSLRALSVLQFYAMKRIVDTAVRADLRAPGAWHAVRAPLFQFFAVVAVFIVLEWGVWYCSYSSRIPVLARARQLVFTYAQRHSPTYFDNMLTGKVAHRAMLLPEQTVTLFERTNWDYLPLAAQCGLLLVLFFRAQPTFAAILAGLAGRLRGGHRHLRAPDRRPRRRAQRGEGAADRPDRRRHHQHQERHLLRRAREGGPHRRRFDRRDLRRPAGAVPRLRPDAPRLASAQPGDLRAAAAAGAPSPGPRGDQHRRLPADLDLDDPAHPQRLRHGQRPAGHLRHDRQHPRLAGDADRPARHP